MRGRRRKSGKANLGGGLIVVVLMIGAVGSLFKQTPPAPAPPAVSVAPAPRLSEERRPSPTVQPTAPPHELDQPVNPVALPESSKPDPVKLPGAPASIRGSKVALRSGPGKDFPVLDRYDRGRRVRLLDSKAPWAQIRDEITQREGWVSAALLDLDKPDGEGAEKEKPKPDVKQKPVLPDTLIIQRLIAESLASYPGNCPCPENRDRAGHRCGARSAHSRGGGYAPLCYASDVTADMIAGYKSRGE